MMTVEILSIAVRGEWDVAVTFLVQSSEHSQKETFVIPTSMVADLCLRVGPAGTDCYDAVSAAAERSVALKRGMYLLGYGSCSECALVRKLMDKGIAKETAVWAAGELAARGYLNEEADALREAEKCLIKLWGQRRIVTTLMTKGFSQKAIKRAMYELEDREVDFSALCLLL